jgi:predicted DNA-binding transcriptional regulator YafY
MARGESIRRQWNLLKALQSQRTGITTDELAERVECSRRQVQRDLDILRNEAGFPIYPEVRDFGKKFWKVSPHFIENDQLVLTMTELLSLYLCEQYLFPLNGTPFGDGISSLFKKVRSVLPDSTFEHFQGLEERVLVKNAAFQDYSQHHREISMINRAVTEEKKLDIRYHSTSSDEAYQSQFDPYGVVIYGTGIYCIGYMHEPKHNGIRSLKVSRIKEVKETNASFEYPSHFSLKEYIKNSFGVFTQGQIQRIRVRYTGWARINVLEQVWHVSQKVIERKKDHVIVEFQLYDSLEFLRWILGFGQHAVILEPLSLARQVYEVISESAKHYNDQWFNSINSTSQP